ncbi:unnamed protein product, partial [Prunus brigantina]
GAGKCTRTLNPKPSPGPSGERVGVFTRCFPRAVKQRNADAPRVQFPALTKLPLGRFEGGTAGPSVVVLIIQVSRGYWLSSPLVHPQTFLFFLPSSRHYMINR